MAECQTHTLAFIPGARVGDAKSLHLLIDKPADVCDLVCPVCGLTLFIYYRLAPRGGSAHVGTTETGNDIGGNQGSQSTGGEKQQKEGDTK